MKKRVYILLLLAFAAIVAGATFAFVTWRSSTNTTVTFTVTPQFSCGADGGGNIASAGLVPAHCTNENYVIKRQVTVKATTSVPMYMDLKLKVNSIGGGLSGTNNFKYVLSRSSSSCSGDNIVTEGTFYGATADTELPLLTSKQYTSNTNETYWLYVWLDWKETNASTTNQSFSLSLTGSCTDQTPVTSTTLYNTIASLSLGTDTDNDINYLEGSELDNSLGVYQFTGDSDGTGNNPIYFYRGAVENNNVIFNNICWLIVRTTGTGGVKMIYNGTPSNGTCTGAVSMITGEYNGYEYSYQFNEDHYDPKYVGYTYEGDTDSTIKGVIDAWYGDNFNEAMTAKLEDTIYCNDREQGTDFGDYYYFAATDRIEAGEPSLSCTNNDDKYTVDDSLGNGLLDNPVAMLTVDEIMLAGVGREDNEYVNYYLYNGDNWWSLSPYNWDSQNSYACGWIDSGSTLGGDPVDIGNGARPVVSLQPGTTILSNGADGTSSKPFVVE